MTEPTVVTVRTLLAHFRSTLATARQTGEPVVIALRRRQPAAVLLGYEAWQAVALRQTGQADTAALQAELAAARQRNGKLTAELAAAHRQVAEVSRDLAAERQRVTELAAQLAKPQTAGQMWGSRGPVGLARRHRRGWLRPGRASRGAVWALRSRPRSRAGAVVTGTRAGPAARNGIGYLAAMNCRLTRRARKWPCLAHKRPPRHPYPLICGYTLWAACRVRGRLWVSSHATIHRCESLTFALRLITGTVNGVRDADATRPHRCGGAWSVTVAVTLHWQNVGT